MQRETKMFNRQDRIGHVVVTTVSTFWLLKYLEFIAHSHCISNPGQLEVLLPCDIGGSRLMDTLLSQDGASRFTSGGKEMLENHA